MSIHTTKKRLDTERVKAWHFYAGTVLPPPDGFELSEHTGYSWHHIEDIMGLTGLCPKFKVAIYASWLLIGNALQAQAAAGTHYSPELITA